MTHYINHTYDELLPAAWPGLEIHIVYNCKSEIVVDDDGEHDPRLISISARVDVSHLSLTLPAPSFPLESHGRDARKFLAVLRQSARQALWARALEAAEEAGYNDADLNMAAYRWMKTGRARLLSPIDKPEKPFVI